MTVAEIIKPVLDQIASRGHEAIRRDGTTMLEAFHVTTFARGPHPLLADEVALHLDLMERLDRRMLKEQVIALWHGCCLAEGLSTRKCFAHSQSMDCPVGFGAQLSADRKTLHCWMPLRSVDVKNKFHDDVVTGLWIANELGDHIFGATEGSIRIQFDLFNAHYRKE